MKMSRIMGLVAAICLAYGAGGTSVLADPLTNSNCGKSGAEHWSNLRESLVGHWKITHYAGYALAGTMIIPFPADGQADMVTIALIGDVLEVSHPEMQAPMVLNRADEPAWTMENPNPAIPRPTLTLSDAVLLVGCDQMDLPRIIGTTSATVEGTRMDFVNRFVFLDGSTLYGVMEMTTVAHGTPVRAVRTVSLSRDGKP
jgi:hypothetical protein